MKIVTWNVNSIRQRLDHLLQFLKDVAPDVVCLQELKCQDEAFPREAIEELGYRVETHGQKGFNGVALLSKFPLEDVTRGLPGDNDDLQARYIEALVSSDAGMIRVVCLYLPNGNPPDTEKYPYKINWMARLQARVRELLTFEEPLVLAGDYNVIPAAIDCHDPAVWAGDALFLPLTRNHFQRLLSLGLTDAIRATSDRRALYTFWDYQAGAWQKNAGIRIDHLLLSPQATDMLHATTIHKSLRQLEKPSDHVPVSVDLVPHPQRIT